jgi:hypothetical protein
VTFVTPLPRRRVISSVHNKEIDMTTRFDYRRQYKNMSIEQLKEQMVYNKAQYDKYFIKVGGTELANEYYKIYSYLKSKIEKKENA